MFLNVEQNLAYKLWNPLSTIAAMRFLLPLGNLCSLFRTSLSKEHANRTFSLVPHQLRRSRTWARTLLVEGQKFYHCHPILPEHSLQPG